MLFDYYDEPLPTNDLMTIINIMDRNVGAVVFTPQLYPKVLPKVPSMERYSEALSSFSAYLEFYESIPEEGEHAEILSYYKLKHSRLSLIALHAHYLQLRTGIVDREDTGYYNEDLVQALLECNEYVSNRDPSDIFLAPFYLSRFFRKNGELGKYRALRREARSVAKVYNKLHVIRMLEAEEER
jgi:hypothetical protein